MFSISCQLLRTSYKSAIGNISYINKFTRFTTSQVKLTKENTAENLKNESQKQLRIPRGTKDYTPEQIARRQVAFEKIINCFKRHGAGAIDTPIFELKETLTEKYGDENKLIYDLVDQGDEKLSLRYDLTVPFARFLAVNKITNYKRYHIGKVYRRDSPNVSRGRYREFYQCDFDIAGKYDIMLPDAECVRIIAEILNDLDFKNFIIKVNHRRILDGILKICEVPSSKFKTVCSSIDKLGKISWEDIKKELIEEQQLNHQIVDMIGNYITKNGGPELIDELLNDDKLSEIKQAKDALYDMKIFFIFSKIYNIINKISFDLSLVRGLDYYTGIIYEAVLTGEKVINIEKTIVGSVAGGGRYDNLVVMLDSDQKIIPCVGLSIGIERLFTIMDAREKYSNQHIRKVYTCADVYVASAQKNMLEERMKICKELWESDIKTEQSYKANPKFIQQIHYCEEHNIPWMVIIGESELERGLVKLRHISTREEIEISRVKITEELKIRLKNK